MKLKVLFCSCFFLLNCSKGRITISSATLTIWGPQRLCALSFFLERGQTQKKRLKYRSYFLNLECLRKHWTICSQKMTFIYFTFYLSTKNCLIFTGKTRFSDLKFEEFFHFYLIGGCRRSNYLHRL